MFLKASGTLGMAHATAWAIPAVSMDTDAIPAALFSLSPKSEAVPME